MSDPAQLALTVAIGVATGILSGMFGVGGAVISTPAIRVMGVSAIDAVGTTIPSILPSAVSGTLRYHREGLVRWNVVVRVALFGTASAVGGALLSHEIPGNGHILMIATALLVGFTAWRMARARDEPESPLPAAVPDTPLPTVPDARPGEPSGERGKVIATGIAAGGLNGLLGVGGGIIMVPAFAEWIGYPIKESVGTSLACVGLLAIPSMITHAFLGDIDWGFALALSIGVVPGARIGAAFAIRSSDRRLRITVATLLGIIAVIYAIGELGALR